VRTALQKAAAAVEREADPVERVRAVGVLFAEIDEAQAAIAQVRLTAVLELRAQGWSLDQIGRATGLSKARVAQIARDPRRV
jgi:hypothetical protein